MNRARYFRILWTAAITVAAAFSQSAPEVRHLSLTEAVHLAIAQNRLLKISRLKVVENEQKKAAARSDYFPSLTNHSNAHYETNLENIGIPAGALGIAGGSFVPSRNVIIPQGDNKLISSGTTLAQPLTQLVRIHQANRIAAAELAVSHDDLKKAENQVALQVHSLYFGILIASLQKQAAEQQSGYNEAHLRENEEGVRNGSALKVATMQDQAGVLESRQAVLTADFQVSDLTTELNDVLGLPLDTRLELDAAPPQNIDRRPRAEYIQTAWSQNPEILAAAEVVAQARVGITAAKSAYLPDITAFARHSYQDGIPFLVRNFGTFGGSLDWDLFDFGKRRAMVREREAQLAQAQQNLERLKEEIAVTIERSYNKVERTKSLVEVADQVVKLRQESERLTGNQQAQGTALVSDRRQATAATFKAQADFLQANLGYLLAWAELEQAIGHTPGL